MRRGLAEKFLARIGEPVAQGGTESELRKRLRDAEASKDEPGELVSKDGRVQLHIFVDWSSVEVFGGDGQAVITDQIFPMPSSDGLALFANGGTAKVSLRIWQLKSIWGSQ